MAVVTFHRLWIHRLEALEDALPFWVAEGEETHSAPRVERRLYGGGGVRMVSGPGRLTDLGYSLADVSRVDMHWLRDLAGELALFRDPRGRVVEGFYPEVQVTELAGSGTTVDVAIAVQVITDRAAYDA